MNNSYMSWFARDKHDMYVVNIRTCTTQKLINAYLGDW